MSNECTRSKRRTEEGTKDKDGEVKISAAQERVPTPTPSVKAVAEPALEPPPKNVLEALVAMATTKGEDSKKFKTEDLRRVFSTTVNLSMIQLKAISGNASRLIHSGATHTVREW